MNIHDKIDEIRQKPEHVRIRWAWGLTAVSMVFIVILWIIFLRSEIGGKKSENTQNNRDILNQLEEQSKSMKDSAGEIKNLIEQSPSQEGFGENK